MNGTVISTHMGKSSIASNFKYLKFLFYSIKNMLLRGCYLRNCDFALCLVVYVGNESKIMKNAKKAPKKISNIMRKMNYMLYTVFAMQFIIIVTFASLSISWMKDNPQTLEFLK